MSKKIERLTNALADAEAERDRTTAEAKAAREEEVRALVDGDGIEKARKRAAAARAAEAEAGASVEAVREALARAKRDELDAARAADVAELTVDARKFAAEAEAGLKAGARAVAEGLLTIGRALVAAADSENADSALESIKAGPEGRVRFHTGEVTDAINAALLSAYPSADSGNPWAEDLRLVLVPLRCVVPTEKK